MNLARPAPRPLRRGSAPALLGGAALLLAAGLVAAVALGETSGGAGGPSGEPRPSAQPSKSRIQIPAGLMAAHGVKPDESAGPPAVAREPIPEGILLVTGHGSGAITPIGCPGSQAGGLARRAGLRSVLRTIFPGRPVFFVDQGGLLALQGGVDRAATKGLLAGMDSIGYEAANVGWTDLGTSFEEAAFVERSLRVPRISANVVRDDNGETVFPPYRILTIPARGEGAGGGAPIRVGIIGLADDRYRFVAFGPMGCSLVPAPMAEALARWLPELRSKADLVVLLANANTSTIAPILRTSPGVDFVVAGSGTEFVTDPVMVEGVPMLAPGNLGRYVVELRIYTKNGRPAIAPFTHWLDERVPEDPDLSRITERALDDINEARREELAAGAQKGLSIAPFVGAAACATCHRAAYESWSGSRHAGATAALVKVHRDFTQACIYCHVTGMNADYGTFSNLIETPQLSGVQCEACHGPAEPHLADPRAPYGRGAEATCTLCHTPGTDPAFTLAERQKSISH